MQILANLDYFGHIYALLAYLLQAKIVWQRTKIDK